MKPVRLGKKEFLEVIDRTPLVCVDLILKDPSNRILLGKRANEPARGRWFVPGGRILKGETIEDAFRRITKAEILYEHSISEAVLAGAFTHYYENNFAMQKGISTHYVVLAYILPVTSEHELKEMELHSIHSDDQHSQYKWLSKEEAISSPGNEYDVHPNTMVYYDYL